MTLEDGLYQFLTTRAGVTAIVSSRVYRSIIPESAPLPAIMFFRVIDDRVHSFTGPTGLTIALMQISCFSSVNDGQAIALADQVRLAIDGKSGTWGTVVVQYAKVNYRNLPPDPADPGTFQIALDVSVSFIQQAP